MFNNICDESIEIGNPFDPDVKLKVTRVKLNKDPHYYTLDLTYTLETPSDIKEIRLPKVQLPLSEEKIDIVVHRTAYGTITGIEGNVGFGRTRLDLDIDGNAYYVKTIEKKPKK